MTIRDKIRDELYGSLEDERKGENEAVGFDRLLESQDSPYEAPKTLLICVLAEIGFIGAIFFGWRWVGTVANTEYVVYLAIALVVVPFFLGFTIAFTSYRLVKEKFSCPEQPFDGPMSLVYRSESDGQMAVWYISAAGGLVNFVAINVFLLIMTGWVTL